MLVRTTQAVIRTAAGEAVWRTEQLPPEERWLLGATRSPVAWGDLLVAASTDKKWPADRLEQALGRALRKGWMLPATPAEIQAAFPEVPVHQANTPSQALEHLLHRYEEAPVAPPEDVQEQAQNSDGVGPDLPAVDPLADEEGFDPAALFSGIVEPDPPAPVPEFPVAEPEPLAEDDSLWHAMGLSSAPDASPFMGNEDEASGDGGEQGGYDPPPVSDVTIPPYGTPLASPPSTSSLGVPRIPDSVKGPWQNPGDERPSPAAIPSELGRQRELIRRQAVARQATKEQFRQEQAMREKASSDARARVERQRQREEHDRARTNVLGVSERLMQLQEAQRQRALEEKTKETKG